MLAQKGAIYAAIQHSVVVVVMMLLKMLMPMAMFLNVNVGNTSVVKRMIKRIAVMMTLMNVLMLNVLFVRHHWRSSERERSEKSDYREFRHVEFPSRTEADLQRSGSGVSCSQRSSLPVVMRDAVVVHVVIEPAVRNALFM